jgi:hypothetical protein
VEIEIQLVGNAFVFMTPTQLSLIRDLLSMLTPSTNVKPDTNTALNSAGGHPLRPEHYTHIMHAAAASAFSGDSLPLDHILGQTFRDLSSPHSNSIGTAASTNTAFYEFQRNTPQRRSASVAITNQKFTTISLQDDINDNQHRRHGSGSAAIYGDSDSLTDRGTQRMLFFIISSFNTF